jgi:hypothetical protein
VEPQFAVEHAPILDLGTATHLFLSEHQPLTP